MASVRAHHRITEDLQELQIEVFHGRPRLFLTVEESLGRENDENSPMLASPSVQERAAVLRPSPRLPLQDITHLFPSNVLNTNVKLENARNPVADRVRRRPLDSPTHSKKRRLSEDTSPSWERPSRPASKSSRPSAGLRSFR
ncbi:hypothetical protein Mapa_004879 [Marchantia paleacea]|nr:hypothetical protein Mapa_004879 [Marchantia paleacea]